jgi:hypothetical protein
MPGSDDESIKYIFSRHASGECRNPALMICPPKAFKTPKRKSLFRSLYKKEGCPSLEKRGQGRF